MKTLNIEEVLKIINIKGVIKSSELVDLFGVSRQYVSRILNGLVKDKVIIKLGAASKTFYTTENFIENNKGVIPNTYSKFLNNSNLEEHTIISDIQHDLLPLAHLSENIESIFEYAFSEMLNNAIEHSSSNKIKISVSIIGDSLTFNVEDFGIGVFRNIMNKKNLTSPIEAIQELLKGKTTTMPTLHSGEGIFFTSKVSDEFILDSYGYQLIVDNLIDDVFIKKVHGQKQGTKVTFKISIKRNNHLNDIFKKYTNIDNGSDYGFDKTEIRIKLYTIGGVHISRSQARRILSGLEKFKFIIMDYDKVPTIGQAFADEIYRVFKNKRPDIEIQNINTNESVDFMINRAINEAKIEK